MGVGAGPVIRILEVCEPPEGGATENVAQLALGLHTEHFQVEVAGPPRARGLEALRKRGVRRWSLPLVGGYSRPAEDARALGALARLLRRRRYDLVHLHSSKAGVLGRLAGRLAGVPVVYTPHCFPFIQGFSSRRDRAATAVERSLAPLTAATICVCEWERAEALRRKVGPAARLTVVYNGCAPCPADIEPDAGLLALRGEGRLAAALCHLRPQKSVDTLIEAAPRFLESSPDARLAVVGDGPDRVGLEELANGLGLLGHPRFAMFGFRAPAARYLTAMDLYVLPSAWEAFPIGVLEAQACGVPQVATDVGGTGEAVDRATGRLVPARDPAALADAMSELLADPGLLERLGHASRARHAERFTVERMLAETEHLYRELLSGRFPW
jgi:glycosyltransferase involved in cell wall biosynthesis